MTVSSSEDGHPLMSSPHQAVDCGNEPLSSVSSSSLSSSCPYSCTPRALAVQEDSRAIRPAITFPFLKIAAQSRGMASCPSQSRRESIVELKEWQNNSANMVCGTPFSARLMIISLEID